MVRHDTALVGHVYRVAYAVSCQGKTLLRLPRGVYGLGVQYRGVCLVGSNNRGRRTVELLGDLPELLSPDLVPPVDVVVDDDPQRKTQDGP